MNLSNNTFTMASYNPHLFLIIGQFFLYGLSLL
jgi:hypothetical protein